MIFGKRQSLGLLAANCVEPEWAPALIRFGTPSRQRVAPQNPCGYRDPVWLGDSLGLKPWLLGWSQNTTSELLAPALLLADGFCRESGYRESVSIATVAFLRPAPPVASANPETSLAP